MKFRFGEKSRNYIVRFGDIFPDLIEDAGLDEAFFLESISENWSNYVGSTLAVHSSPDRIFKNILFVRVDHPMYANELSLYKNLILKKIFDDLGKNFIYNIKFEVKKSRWSKK